MAVRGAANAVISCVVCVFVTRLQRSGPMWTARGQILKSEHFKPCRTVGKPGVPGTPLSNRETTEQPRT